MSVERAPQTRRGVGIGIVAGGASKAAVNWSSDEWSYWSMNDFYLTFVRKMGKLFEMHPISHYTDPTQYHPQHETRMAEFRSGLVMLAFPNPKIPNASIYPLDDVLARFKRDYFTSTLCYMIPYAVMQIEQSAKNLDGVYEPRIGIWGADMALTSEYAKERACVEYWCAKAEDAGIELFIPDESPLLKAPYRYGYDTPMLAEWQKVIAARREELTIKLHDAMEEDRAANHKVSTLQGMLEEAAHYEAHLTDAPPNGQPFR